MTLDFFSMKNGDLRDLGATTTSIDGGDIWETFNEQYNFHDDKPNNFKSCEDRYISCYMVIACLQLNENFYLYNYKETGEEFQEEIFDKLVYILKDYYEGENGRVIFQNRFPKHPVSEREKIEVFNWIYWMAEKRINTAIKKVLKERSSGYTNIKPKLDNLSLSDKISIVYDSEISKDESSFINNTIASDDDTYEQEFYEGSDKTKVNIDKLLEGLRIDKPLAIRRVKSIFFPSDISIRDVHKMWDLVTELPDINKVFHIFIKMRDNKIFSIDDKEYLINTFITIATAIMIKEGRISAPTSTDGIITLPTNELYYISYIAGSVYNYYVSKDKGKTVTKLIKKQLKKKEEFVNCSLALRDQIVERIEDSINSHITRIAPGAKPLYIASYETDYSDLEIGSLTTLIPTLDKVTYIKMVKSSLFVIDNYDFIDREFESYNVDLYIIFRIFFSIIYSKLKGQTNISVKHRIYARIHYFLTRYYWQKVKDGEEDLNPDEEKEFKRMIRIKIYKLLEDSKFQFFEG